MNSGNAWPLCRYAGNKANSAAKQLNNTNIKTKAAAPNRKIGLSNHHQTIHLSYCENNHHLAAIIISDCVSIPSLILFTSSNGRLWKASL